MRNSSRLEGEAWLDAVEAALADAEAALSTDLGGHVEATTARLWRGQVLVDWEPDAQAGGCLLRPALLRRLCALHARVTTVEQVRTRQGRVRIGAPGHVVAALSTLHAELVERLGGPRRVQLEIELRFAEAHYLGGHETYFVAERGRRVPFLRLSAEVQRKATAADAHTPGADAHQSCADAHKP
jgi:hypothetical protein